MDDRALAAPRGQLFGSTNRHARVVVMTVTDKEFPVARSVFGACGALAEVDQLGAYTSAQFADSEHLPFVLVRASDRGNLATSADVAHWMREFRPQAFVVVGTAGGVWRPADEGHTKWSGPHRGDVVVSEYLHYGDYRKVTAGGSLLRHNRLEQPADYLLRHARSLIDDPDVWHQWLGSFWQDLDRNPEAVENEMVAGGQIQDDPLEASQQWLMKTFDRAGAVEMESAGVALALHQLRETAMYAPMYLSVRGVSDLVWARSPERKLTDSDIGLAKAFDATRTMSNAEATALRSGKTSERQFWSPLAAASASAFALAMVQRLVRRSMRLMPGHPPIPGFELEMSAPTSSLVS